MNEFYNKLKFFEETEKIPSKIYYHYTSLDALFDIVRTHTFRLMSLKSSNDKKELYYSPNIFLQDLKRISKTTDNNDIKSFFEIVLRSLEAHKSTLLNFAKSPSKPYALCLATKKDNLTHWDRYADGCKGVCIGFNVSALDVYYHRMNSLAFGSAYFDIGKALYSHESIDNHIIREIARFSKMLRDFSQEWKEPYTEKFVEDKIYLLAISLCNYIIKFAKNASFIDEDEVRLYHDGNTIKDTLRLIDGMKGEIEDVLYQNTRKNFLEIGNEFNIIDDNFAMTSRGIRSYKNLCLNPIWGSGVIPEIIIGPMCMQNKRELQAFLKANGLEGTKVTISSVPVR